jgi:hypothetical protein
MDTLWFAITGLGITILSSSSAGLIWAIRQEGRINGHDKLFEEREKQTDDKFEQIESRAQERHMEMMSRMDRLENLAMRRG